MRSGFAEAIELFFAHGGVVTICPEGNGLIPPEWRPKTLVGSVSRSRRKHERCCALALAAVAAAHGPVAIPAIMEASALSYNGARAALETLVTQGRITVRNGAGRIKLYAVRDGAA